MTFVDTPQGRFTAEIVGPPTGNLVVLLHGYPQTRHTWRHQLAALGDRGYHGVAYDGRGYSPGVRPDPSLSLEPYRIERLVADVLDVAHAVGGQGCRFHLVGHDWGGQVAWATSVWHPDRVRSLSVLSRPHPGSFRHAMKADTDGQRHRSRHHQAFHDPETGRILLEDDARRLRRGLREGGVPPEAIRDYLDVLGSRDALEGALAWYRAAGTLSAIDVGPVDVPTLYVWGDLDQSVGRAAAEGTARWATAGYRFVELAGIGHFATDEVPERITAELLAWLAEHP